MSFPRGGVEAMGFHGIGKGGRLWIRAWGGVIFSQEGEYVPELGERTLSIQGIEIKGGCFQDGGHPHIRPGKTQVDLKTEKHQKVTGEL